MGRNIFQSEHPVEMAKAIRMIVHQKATDKEAYEFYQDAIHAYPRRNVGEGCGCGSPF